MFSIFDISQNRSVIKRKDLKTSIIDDLESKLPSFTPDSPDNIVFVLVEEGKSSSVNDVGQYLQNLKENVTIGKEGYPKQCVVCGN